MEIAPLSFRGLVTDIHVASVASDPMTALAEATLEPGVGIVGDRYATRRGTYSDRHHVDRQITLIEAETLDALLRDRGIVVAPHEHRRNITTRGVPLNHLVGRYLRVGECVLYGGRLNVPCRYLEDLLERPVFRPLLNRSGLNARVVLGGVIRPGDVVEACDPADLPPALVAANEYHPPEAAPDVF